MADLLYFADDLIDTSALTAAQHAALWQLFDNRRRGRLPLRCTQQHGGEMYLRTQKNRDGATRLIACHYPGQGDESCTVRLETESPAHRNIKAYTVRAAESEGWAAIPEYSTGRGTRVDVYVKAPHPFGIEAQTSKLTARDAKARTTKSTRGGAPPLWLPTYYDAWQAHVPTIRHNDKEIDWHDRTPPRGGVAAVSLKAITAQRCTAASLLEACPQRPGTFCGKYHPHYEPLLRWSLDDAIVGVGDGELAMHQTRNGVVLVVPARDLPLYRELTGLDGVFAPGTTKPPAPAYDRRSRECSSQRAPEPPSSNFKLPELVWRNCQKCGQRCCAPESAASGLCARHFYIERAQLRRMGMVA